ncbi:MAG: hypothetical protein ABI273_03390, partial [Lacunisphaera sp.]
GNVYVADTGNSVIRKIASNGVVTTIAGLAGIAGLMDGAGSNAWFNQPKGIALSSSGVLYVADTGNAAIRAVTLAGSVTTLDLSSSVSVSSNSDYVPAVAPPVASSASALGASSAGPSNSGGGGGAMNGGTVLALLLACLMRAGFLRRRRVSAALGNAA